jgi:hypothetical protein
MSFDLFQLVPAVYRMRDARIAQTMVLLTPAEQAEVSTLQALPQPLSAQAQEQLDELLAKAARGPLQSLLMVVSEQLAALAEDLDQLYDDQFIETCAPWVIPYIGDLIGYQSVQGITTAVDKLRSAVAETISMRRRKGTILVMEQLSRDVTGWGAHAVEFFRLLADTQYMKHVRHGNFYTPNLRSWKPRLRMNTGFDRTAHKVDVRSVTNGRGPYNIQNIGIFLWSLSVYSITHAEPATVSTNVDGDPLCYRFNSLGIDAPLFHRAISQGETIEAAAMPENVPDRLRRLTLCEDMQLGVGSRYYGEGSSLALYLDGKLLNPYQLQVADLSGSDGSWANLPTAGTPYAAHLDPELGRIALPPVPLGATQPVLTTSFYYGFNAEMGGGEYTRGESFLVTDEAWILPYPDVALPARYNDLQQALDFVVGELGAEGQIALEITNSDTIMLNTATPLTVDLPAGTSVELRAADGARPALLLDEEIVVTGDTSSKFVINGLLIGAAPGVTPGNPPPAALVRVPLLRPNSTPNLLAELHMLHCTVLPGWTLDTAANPLEPTAPTLIAEASGVQIVGERSIFGAIRSVSDAITHFTDSVVDATDPRGIAYAALDGELGGGVLTLRGCTVVGKVHAVELSLVTNTILWAALGTADTWTSALIADRRQEGCVRFSFLPVNAITPRRFQCVEQALASAQPVFFTLRYGHPAYLKMLACTDGRIRRGADDGGEMGAFHFVLAPQRESDLKVRLQEYLPVGLEVGLVYQS